MITRIIALLKSGRVQVVQEHIPDWGYCDYEERILTVRKTLCRKNKAKTLIHECVHFLNPSFAEDTVLLIERDLWKHITLEEYRVILFHLGEKK